MKYTIPHRYIILADQALFSGTGFLLTILLARQLDIEDFGTYSGIILGLYLALSAVGAFVIQPFQVLYAGMKHQHSYVSFSFFLQVAAVLFLVLMATLLSWFFPQYISIVTILFAAGFLMHDFGRRLLLAINRPLSTLILDFALSLSLCLSVGVMMLKDHWDLINLFAHLSAAYLLSFLLLLYFIRPLQPVKKDVKPFMIRHLQDGKWLFMTALAQWWAGNLFVVASGLYLGAAALGALRLAQSLMGVLNILLQTFENHVLPQTARIMTSNADQAAQYVTGVSRKAGLLFIPVLMFTFLFSSDIMLLAGGEIYVPYSFVLQGISLLYILIFISQPVRLLIRATLLNRHFFFGYLLSLLFSLSASHFLLSTWGLKGAISGLAIAQLLLLSYWASILQRRNILPWKLFISY